MKPEDPVRFASDSEGASEVGTGDAVVEIDVCELGEDRGFATAEAESRIEESSVESPTVRAEPLRACGFEAGDGSDYDSDYIDELQEAAAGLAKLMRSSPLPRRSEPVVFAPDIDASEAPHDERSEEAIIVEDTGDFDGGTVGGTVGVTACDRIVSTEIAVCGDASGACEEEGVEAGAADPCEEGSSQAAPNCLAADTKTTEESVADADREATLGAEVTLTLEQVLGESVCEELQRIDSGLEALEDLVLEIEGHLASWAVDDLGGGLVEEGFANEPYVGVAA